MKSYKLGLQKCYSFSVEVSLNISLWRRDAWPTPKHTAHLARSPILPIILAFSEKYLANYVAFRRAL